MAEMTHFPNERLFRLLASRNIGMKTEEAILSRVRGQEKELLCWLEENPDATLTQIRRKSHEIEGSLDIFETAEHTRFGLICLHIPEVERTTDWGGWVSGSGPMYVRYPKIIGQVIGAVYEIIERDPEFKNLPFHYTKVLRANDISWSDSGMKNADVSKRDAMCVLSLFIGITCAERFSDGTIGRFFRNGTALHWLKRLDELDTIRLAEKGLHF